MRWSLVAILITLASVSGSHASDVEAPNFAVRAIDHNSDEIFPTLMTLIEARQSLAAKDFERSYELYSILYKYDSNLEGVTEGLSKSFIALGRPDIARQHLLEAENMSPEMEILLTLTTAMTMQGQKAEAYLTQALSKQPDSRLWNLLGLKLGDQGKTKLASEAFREAENLGQNPGVMMNNLGLLEMQRGDFEKAVKYLSISAQNAPENEKYDANRRLALLLNQQYSDALHNLTEPELIKLLEDAAVISKKWNKVYLEEFFLKKLREIDPTFNQTANASLSVN